MIAKTRLCRSLSRRTHSKYIIYTLRLFEIIFNEINIFITNERNQIEWNQNVIFYLFIGDLSVKVFFNSFLLFFFKKKKKRREEQSQRVSGSGNAKTFNQKLIFARVNENSRDLIEKFRVLTEQNIYLHTKSAKV